MKMRSLFLVPVVLLVCYAGQCIADKSYDVLTPKQQREILKKNLPELLEHKKDVTELRQKIENKDYHATYSDNAVSLISMKKNKATKTMVLDDDPYYKKLRGSASEIPLSFSFFGIDSINSENLLGYAPSGTLQDGVWTGITGYFNHVDFGTCRIIIFDLLTTHSKSFYNQEYTSYEINNKPTVRYVEGSDESGFLYNISWTGERYEKILDCANDSPFNSETMSKLISFAKTVDEEVIDVP